MRKTTKKSIKKSLIAGVLLSLMTVNFSNNVFAVQYTDLVDKSDPGYHTPGYVVSDKIKETTYYTNTIRATWGDRPVSMWDISQRMSIKEFNDNYVYTMYDQGQYDYFVAIDKQSGQMVTACYVGGDTAANFTNNTLGNVNVGVDVSPLNHRGSIFEVLGYATTGKIAASDTKPISGGTAYTELRPSANGNYVRKTLCTTKKV